MQVGDFIRVRYVMEFGGVACSNQLNYVISQILGADTIDKIVSDLATAFWASISARMGADVTFSCIGWTNQSRNEQYVGFPALAGGSVSDAHPPTLALRWNLYGQPDPPPAKLKQNAIYLAGIGEAYSDDGRVTSLADFQLFDDFLTNGVVTDPAGVELFPRVRYETAPGPPKVYGFTPLLNAQLNSTYVTVRTRKGSLCAA